jgi:hypothetical protein
VGHNAEAVRFDIDSLEAEDISEENSSEHTLHAPISLQICMSYGRAMLLTNSIFS